MGTYSRFSFVLSLLAVIALTLMPRPAQSDAYTIYFESDRDGETAIYQLSGDNIEQFTDFGCKHPSVTADNNLLIYTRLVETNWGRYWNAFYFSNGVEEKLTRNEIHDELEPVISHDGTFAAYSSLRGSISRYDQQDTQNMEIFTLSFDDNEYQYRITQSPKPDEYPALAGGSDYVYFTGRTGNFSYIFREPGDGGDAERVTDDMTGWEEHPTISADGRYIAYASVAELEEEEVVEEVELEEAIEDETEDTENISDADLSIPGPVLTAIPGIHLYPSYASGATSRSSEEESELYDEEVGDEVEDEDEFTKDGNYDIWVLDTETGERTQLTFDEAWDGNPTISADGQIIVFTSDRDGNYEIYRINVNGSGLERLTDNDAVDDFATIT